MRLKSLMILESLTERNAFDNNYYEVCRNRINAHRHKKYAFLELCKLAVSIPQKKRYYATELKYF
jgi:hypothetical protein